MAFVVAILIAANRTSNRAPRTLLRRSSCRQDGELIRLNVKGEVAWNSRRFTSAWASRHGDQPRTGADFATGTFLTTNFHKEHLFMLIPSLTFQNQQFSLIILFFPTSTAPR
jgi:hypothetical protein